MIDLREVRSVTDFQRNAKEYVNRLKESGARWCSRSTAARRSWCRMP